MGAWHALDPLNVPLALCGAFYAVLCVFSLVTGVIYMLGKRRLNPLELPDSLVLKLTDEGRLVRFTKRMGLVTFIVGLVQGVAACACLLAGGLGWYVVALGFTLFSIASVGFKLSGKVSAFALVKLVAYVAILIVLLLPATRAAFF